MLPFEQGPIRPVAEANSLLIRTTRGCTWNRCAFCDVYKSMAFSIRNVDDIIRDIDQAARYFGDHPFDSCFLQDGDSFVMKTGDLLAVLKHLKARVPTLTRISSYGRASTMIRKSPAEMTEIHDAGLNRLYCGMESGSDAVLEFVRKGITADQLIQAGKMAKDAGMEISEFIIMGLGGRELSDDHARETARVLNSIDPHFIRIRTVAIKDHTPLGERLAEKRFTPCTESEMMAEQRLLLENLTGVTSYYSNDHSVNLMMEIEGQLPEDRDNLIGLIDRFLALPAEEKKRFALGRRLNVYRHLGDRDDLRRRLHVEEQQQALEQRYPGRLDDICRQIRSGMI